MDSDFSRPDPLPPERSSKLKLWIGIGAILFLAFIVFVASRASRKEKLSWLPPNVLSRALQPSALAQYKYKLVRATAPLWRWWRPRRPQICVSCRLVELSGAGVEQRGLGQASATNADGTRAWIVSPEGFTNLNLNLAGEQTGVNSRIIVYNGGPARATMGPGSVITGIPLGLTVDVVPSLAGHSVKIILGASYIKLNRAAPANPTVATNFSAACRAFVPNGGALVLQAGRTNPAAATNYLLLVSPVVTDAQGKPVKL